MTISGLVILFFFWFFYYIYNRIRKYENLILEVMLMTRDYPVEKYNENEIIVVILYKKITIQNFIKDNIIKKHEEILKNSKFYDSSRQ